jgi:hypothetical protein
MKQAHEEGDNKFGPLAYPDLHPFRTAPDWPRKGAKRREAKPLDPF